MSLISLLRKVFKREDGVTAIEFAMVAPPLFLILLGTIEYGIVMATQSALEAAVTKTSRHYKALSRTEAQAGGASSDTIDMIKNEIWKTLTKGQFGIIKNQGNLRVYANLLGSGYNAWSAANSVNKAGSGNAGNDNFQTDAAMYASGKGDCRSVSGGDKRSCSFFSGDVVQYQVYYDYYFTTPILKTMVPKIVLNASMVVQNEPDM